jgi:DNA-binding transcriptional MerR regulator
MKGLTRGQLAQRADINLETVRFYEKEGLLPPAPRSASGYRQFAETAVDRLEFVKQAKDLGFSLAEIRELLALQDGNGYGCIEVRDKLQNKLIALRAKKAELERLETLLRSAMRKCDRQLEGSGSQDFDQCPVLKQMAGTARSRS